MSDRSCVVVTGASGFVGRALVTTLAADPRFDVRACYRKHPTETPAGATPFITGDFGEAPDLAEALTGADVVVHCAARAHIVHESEPDPLAAYRRENVAGTVALAQAAASSGVRRFVYLSSIKVNGESTPIDRPFGEDDPPAPQDPYGLSKLEAERGLWRIAKETGLEVTVLRPPLVYGPGAKGNLERLMRLIARGVPLPFGAIQNKRSMIGLQNLVSVIVAAITHRAVVGRTFLLSDQSDLSTPQLIRSLSAAMEKPLRLFPVPVRALRLAGAVIGRSAEIERLTGSLRVDSTTTSRALDWPRIGTEQGLRQMAEAFQATQRRAS